MSDPWFPAFETFWFALSLRVDSVTAEVVRAFEAAGVPSILLKGAALREWLYDDGAVRSYGDSDLLVPWDSWETAQGVLRDLGFEDALAPLDHPRMQSVESHPWRRGDDAEVDLHASFFGIEAPPETAWRQLEPRTQQLTVGGHEVRVLDPVGQT